MGGREAVRKFVKRYGASSLHAGRRVLNYRRHAPSASVARCGIVPRFVHTRARQYNSWAEKVKTVRFRGKEIPIRRRPGDKSPYLNSASLIITIAVASPSFSAARPRNNGREAPVARRVFLRVGFQTDRVFAFLVDNIDARLLLFTTVVHG